LLTRDKFGTPAMNLEARRRKAEVCKWATAEITPEELNNIFLLSKSNKQVTACRVAAYKGNRDELVKLREWGKGQSNREEIPRTALYKELRDITHGTVR